MTKKTIAILLTIMLLLAAGCAEKEPEPTPTPDPHAGEVLVSDGAGGFMWVKDYENLARNSYDATCFSPDGQYITYNSGDITSLRGIDISFYQGDIDWNAVKSDGVDFAIIRCGYRGASAGSLNTDEKFAQNLEGAKAAGIKVGVYFFSQAISPEEAREEARYTIDLLAGQSLDMPVFFDWEHVQLNDGPSRTDDLDGKTLTDCCLAFCDEIGAAGYDFGVYFYRSLGYNLYQLDRLQGLCIWAACPGITPDFYYDFDMWQYSFTASVSGIEGDTDLDLYFVR